MVLARVDDDLWTPADSHRHTWMAHLWVNDGQPFKIIWCQKCLFTLHLHSPYSHKHACSAYPCTHLFKDLWEERYFYCVHTSQPLLDIFDQLKEEVNEERARDKENFLNKRYGRKYKKELTREEGKAAE